MDLCNLGDRHSNQNATANPGQDITRSHQILPRQLLASLLVVLISLTLGGVVAQSADVQLLPQTTLVQQRPQRAEQTSNKQTGYNYGRGRVKHCMSTWQLKDAVELNAWTGIVKGRSYKVVILTSADARALKATLRPFAANLQGLPDGDLTKHLIVVANGLAGYVVCDNVRADFKHQCVLDHFCGASKNSKSQGMTFQSQDYAIAAVQRMSWVIEALKLDTSVLWMDMDVVVYKNPLPVLLGYNDADFMISSEFCDTKTDDYDTPAVRWQPGSQFEQNGGLYLVHPTPEGKALLDFWLGQLKVVFFYEGYYHSLDQHQLMLIFRDGMKTVPVYQKLVNGTFVEVDRVRFPENIRVYRMTLFFFQNMCRGPCGFGPQCQDTSLPMNILPNGVTECIAPPDHINKWVTFHINCEKDLYAKVQFMKRLKQGMIRAVGQFTKM